MSKAQKRRNHKRKSNNRRRANRPAETVAIERIAAQGDGEGLLADGNRIYVPFTVPGDRVTVQPTHARGEGFAGHVVDTVSAAARKETFCKHFGICGGCKLQHLPDPQYNAWKRDLVVVALKRQGLETHVHDLLSTPIDSRRRASLRAIRTAQGLQFGFNAALSDRIVPINDCPLLVSSLRRLVGPIAELLENIMPVGTRGAVALTELRGMIDIVLDLDMDWGLAAHETLAAFAETFDIARISRVEGDETEPEPLIVRSDITIDFAGLPVGFPPGGFLQPSAEGEQTLQRLVVEAVGANHAIADLFCGLGTFAVTLAKAGRQVLAVDGDQRQISALTRSVASLGLDAKLRAETRNLFKSPLTKDELTAFDTVVFDPPRAGAKAQAAELAASDVKSVVAVSCNPSTLARDLNVLESGGFKTEWVSPLDQFLMSHHVEAVAYLSR